MKKAFLFALFALVASSSFGQKISFSDSTNVWRWFNHAEWLTSPIVGYYTDSFAGDTTIQANVYRTLYHPFHNPTKYVFIREDTGAKKVFIIAPYYDTTEVVLYDYLLGIGDTFSCHHSKHYVSGIDSVLINAVSHKVWHFTHASTDSTIASGTPDYDVIEGIGCIKEPCFPLRPYVFEPEPDVTCFSNNGTTPPLSHKVGMYFDNDTSCSLTFGLFANNVYLRNNVDLYPNPIDNTSKILFPYHIASGSVVIINSIGEIISKLSFENKDEIIIGDKIKIPGIYHYRVTDDLDGKVFSGKFIRQ